MFLALVMVTPTLAAGGTFSATDNGRSSISNCGALSGRRACVIRLNGQGTATSLGRVFESGRLTADLRFGLFGDCGPAFGTITLYSQANLNNSVRFAVRGQVCKAGLLGLGAATYSLTYNVSGGSGTFMNATGTGRVNGRAGNGFLTNQGTYSDQFNGTLNF
jgi:hypothetical protein